LSADEIKTRVRGFILNEFLPGENPENLTDSTELISGGILDSLATLKLVAFLEETYRIAIGPDELTADNLNTLPLIVGLVQEKQA
jgi:acyl carrier protein